MEVTGGLWKMSANEWEGAQFARLLRRKAEGCLDHSIHVEEASKCQQALQPSQLGAGQEAEAS